MIPGRLERRHQVLADVQLLKQRSLLVGTTAGLLAGASQPSRSDRLHISAERICRLSGTMSKKLAHTLLPGRFCRCLSSLPKHSCKRVRRTLPKATVVRRFCNLMPPVRTSSSLDAVQRQGMLEGSRLKTSRNFHAACAQPAADAIESLSPATRRASCLPCSFM